MNVLRLKSMLGFGKTLGLSVSLLAAQAIVPTALQPLSIDVGFGVAQAQNQSKEKKKEKKTKRTQAMSNKVYEKVVAAQEAVETKDFATAIEILDELQNRRKGLNGAEQANVFSTYAYIYYAQENYGKAIEANKKIIAIVDGPEGPQINARYQLAQLYFIQDQWKPGVEALLAWFEVSEIVGANAYMLLAQGYYQLKDYDGALTNVEVAIGMYKEKDKTPKESWYGLQRFLYYEKNDYKKVVEILNETMLYYPKKTYWIVLSAMYSELKSEVRQLAAMETAYVQGMLDKERELLNMAYIFLANDVPYKAAKVIDKGIREKTIEPTSKNLELLGNAWRQSQEVAKAIPEMKKAAGKSDKGELWSRLCSMYLDGDQYKNAVNACNKGIKKGGLKRVDQTNLILGMAHYNLKQYNSARKAFNKALKDKRTKKMANQWIKFMDNEIRRQKSMQEV